MARKFKSRYIIDVSFEDHYIELVDSQHGKYYIDIADSDTVSVFKLWFDEIYLKGVPQFLTVFEYESLERGECEVFNVIKRLHYRKKEQTLNG